jgi:hypothetical protein
MLKLVNLSANIQPIPTAACVAAAVLRWAEECRIVQEARRQQLDRMVAPGSLLYRLVQDHGADLQGMEPLAVALSARAILTMPAATLAAAAAPGRNTHQMEIHGM